MLVVRPTAAQDGPAVQDGPATQDGPPAPEAAADNGVPNDGAGGAGEGVPGDNAQALPGIIRVGIPHAGRSPIGLSASADYGLFEAAGDLDSASHRVGGNLAASWSPIQLVSLYGSLDGAVQLTPGEPTGSDSSSYGEPALGVRGQGQLNEHVHLGGELAVEFIGREAPSVDFSATTPTLSALAACELATSTWLALSLGYRFDNSAASLQQPELLQVGDRFLLEASSFSALEWGLGVSHRLGATELLAEFSAQTLVGNGAPGFFESPLGLAAGARHRLDQRWEVRGHAELSPSARPDPFPSEDLVPFRPRFAIGVGVAYRFATGDVQEQSAPPEVIDEPAPEPEQVEVSLRGRVVDEGGRPQTDVLVRLQGEGREPAETRTYADGSFEFDNLEPGSAVIAAETPGFEPTEKKVELSEDEQSLELVIYPALPAGEVHGKVLDMAGNPIDATVSVRPGDETVEVAADGSFSVELRPGRYAITFSHPNYSDQVRTVSLSEGGVIVLNIALQK